MAEGMANLPLESRKPGSADFFGDFGIEGLSLPGDATKVDLVGWETEPALLGGIIPGYAK